MRQLADSTDEERSELPGGVSKAGQERTLGEFIVAAGESDGDRSNRLDKFYRRCGKLLRVPNLFDVLNRKSTP